MSSLLPGGLSVSTVRMLALRMTAWHSSVNFLAGRVIYLAVQPSQTQGREVITVPTETLLCAPGGAASLESCCVAEASLEFALLPHPPESWGTRCDPPT